MESSDIIILATIMATTIIVGLIILIVLDKRFKTLIPSIQQSVQSIPIIRDITNPATLSGVPKGTKFRKTLDENGNEVLVASTGYLYLGRTVNDRGPEGYSHVSEIRDTLIVMKREHRKGVIDARTLNARQMRLKGVIEQSELGEFQNKTKKIEAIREINRQRYALGWKPLSADVGSRRPTKVK